MKLALILCVVCVASSACASAATVHPPLATALFDPETFATTQAYTAFTRVRSAGATYVRLALDWAAVAPDTAAKPAGLKSADPADPNYQWGAFDRQVRAAVAAGLQPIVDIYSAPKWAEGPRDTVKGDPPPGGTFKPDPTEFGLFARAAAAHYSGASGLPRVRYWQAWNEPNISLFLVPQFENGQPFSPQWYRRMVNAFAVGVYAAHKDNYVVAGGTAPFRDITGSVLALDPDWGPLSFMRQLLCLSPTLKRTCSNPVHFDVWGHDPYTSGGPTHHAVLPNDVSLGDLPEMRRVLDAGVRAHTVVSRHPIQFWVTEFSWDTNAPDPKGVPMALATRWVAEGLYRMWLSRVDLVTWFLLRDEDITQGYYQSGLYFEHGSALRHDQPKGILQAFRFPFVGLPQRGGVLVWGRTPGSKPGTVLVDQSFQGGWRRLAVLHADANGIFQQRFAVSPTGSVRARTVGAGAAAAVPFSLKSVPDQFFNPFGSSTQFEPPAKK